MIITFTANPSIDRTLRLDAELRRGHFQRAHQVSDEASGKGINVATALRDADEPVLAVVAFADPAYLGLMSGAGRVEPLVALVKAGLRVRTNITITEPDGTTTKVNEPGPGLDAEDAAMITDALVHIVRQYRADWVALSGSLPPGVPDDWYVQISRALQVTGCRIAVDASDRALPAVVERLESTGIGLLKPNVDELAQVLGVPAAELQDAVDHGDLDAVTAGAGRLHERGVEEVLVTLGGAGAVLVSAEGSWQAEAPSVKVRSTVGAGDAALAGYLLAWQRGMAPDVRLAYAVAHGSAAVEVPGSGHGKPRQDDVAAVRVRRLE
ncbi:MAG: 1-phosphofructokinase family hexose kinase [Brooklawnia sp.]|uniref:1-phosphofructokinase family hexose kinase n=1 Tax=Brooklawnia sp. TaxID=2699740 RepID=UPI003C7113A2